jgi:hypothetical protein
MKVCSQSAETLSAVFVVPAAMVSSQLSYTDDPRISIKAAPGGRHGMACALLAVSLVSFGCMKPTPVVSEIPVTGDLPEFVGSNRSPSGRGVDLCLHSNAVARNPRSNPNLAWDNESCFTIMGHGLAESRYGPVLLDERLDNTLNLTPSKLTDIVKGDPSLRIKFSRARYVLLYCCNSGSKTVEGMPSFASRLANNLKKPVIAPTNKLIMHGGKGVIRDKGIYKLFYPRYSLHRN